MKHPIYLLLGLLLASSAYGQTSTMLEQVAVRRKAQQQLRDSLEQEFYRQPPYLLVSYYRNAQRVSWSDKMTLYLDQNGQKTVLQPVHGNAFLLPKLCTDTLVIGFKVADQTIALQRLPAWRLQHGATIQFGLIDRFSKRQRQDQKRQHNNDTSPLEEIGVPYYDLLRDQHITQVLHEQQASKLLYEVIEPRVYGDGVLLTSYRLISNKQ